MSEVSQSPFFYLTSKGGVNTAVIFHVYDWLVKHKYCVISISETTFSNPV